MSCMLRPLDFTYLRQYLEFWSRSIKVVVEPTTYFEQLTTDNSTNCGLPSYSHDRRYLVYRVWSDVPQGLRIMDFETGDARRLTTEWDNLLQLSLDGMTILFTRRV